MSDSRNNIIEKVVQTAINAELKELHTCLPGVIQTFDHDTQLAEIQPTIKRKLNGELVNLPLLVDVPIRFPKVAGFCITLPLKAGDEVAVFFIERSIDNWLLNGGIQSPDDIRKHSLSDGFAVPFLYSQENKITDFDANNIQIRNTAGDAFLTIDTSGNILLNGDTDFVTAYTDMKVAFDALVTDFNNLVIAYNTATYTIGGVGTTGTTSIPGVSSTADMSSAKVEKVKVP